MKSVGTDSLIMKMLVRPITAVQFADESYLGLRNAGTGHKHKHASETNHNCPHSMMGATSYTAEGRFLTWV